MKWREDEIMEEFLDEKIVEFRNRARKEKYSTLETGMYIKNELVDFERKTLFQEKLSIILPVSFVDLPADMAKVKYTSQQRPQIIKTSLDTTVNLGLSMTDIKIYEEQIKTLKNQAQEALKRLNPAFVFYESKVETKNVPLGWFEFKSYGLDTDVYNLMFVSRIEGKMLHGIFNCDYDDALEWREAARQMMYSVTDLSKEEKGE